jgi:hypothetical protein
MNERDSLRSQLLDIFLNFELFKIGVGAGAAQNYVGPATLL